MQGKPPQNSVNTAKKTITSKAIPPKKQENQEKTIVNAISKPFVLQGKSLTPGSLQEKPANSWEKTVKSSSNNRSIPANSNTIEKTITSQANPLKKPANSQEKTMVSLDKTLKSPSKPFREEEKTLTSHENDDKTQVFRKPLKLTPSESQEKTHFIGLFQSEMRVNSFKPGEESLHTIKLGTTPSKSSYKSKLGVKISLETSKTLGNSSNLGLFSVEELPELAEDPHDWEIQDVLLGKGAYGNVYRVIDKSKNQAFALKIIELDPNSWDFEFLYEKTLYEVFLMKQANKLNSRSVLRFVDCFRRNQENAEENAPIACNILIIMELCQCSLNDLMEYRRENGVFWTDDQLLYYFYVLLDTLFELARLKIAHRDIKPRNILYNLAEKSVKFADFGEGKLVLGDLSGSLLMKSEENIGKLSNSEALSDQMINTVRGTPFFMSPEVYNSYRSKQISCVYDPLSSDIYSLGLTFFVMKTLNTDLSRQEIASALQKDAKFQAETLGNRLIKLMLCEDAQQRVEKTLLFFEEELKPVAKKLQPPEEAQFLSIYQLKKDESLSFAEKIQKKMLIAKLYTKLNRDSLAKSLLIEVLQSIDKEIKANSLQEIEYLFFKYRNLVSLATIELKEEETLPLGLKRLEEAWEILIKKAQPRLDKETFSHEYGNLLNEFGIAYRRSNKFEKALDFYENALKIAKELGSLVNISAVCYNIGHIFLKIKSYDQAMSYLKQSLKMLEDLSKKPQNEEISLKKLKEELAKSQKLMAEVFYNKKLFETAEEYAEKGLKLMQEIHGSSNVNLLEFLNFLGISCMTAGKHERSLSNFKQSLEISQAFMGKEAVSSIYILNNMGILYNLMGKNEDSEETLLDCAKICEKHSMEKDKGVAFYNLGNLYAKTGKVEKSTESLETALKIFEKLNVEIEKQAFIHYNIGGMAVSAKDFKKVKEHFNAAIKKYQMFLNKKEFAENKNVKKMQEFLKNLK